MRTSLRMSARGAVCIIALALAVPAAQARPDQPAKASAAKAQQSERSAKGRGNRSTAARRKRARRCVRRRCVSAAARRSPVTITSSPESPTTSTSATFAFRSSSSSTFECRLDGAGTWSACSSPKTYSNLALGTHRFEVRLVSSRTQDRTPAAASWTIAAPAEPVPAEPVPTSPEATPEPAPTSPEPTPEPTPSSPEPTPEPAPAEPVADTTPPSAPAGLVAAAGDGSVSLSWFSSSDDTGVAGYRVYRNGSLVGTTKSTTFTAGGLSNGTSYTFHVVAYDAAGNVSAASGSVSASPVAPVTQPAPTGCTVTNSAKPTYTTGRAELVYPMAAPLADSVAAGRVHRSTWEPRPQNTTANRYVPSDAELTRFWSEQAQYGDIRSDLIKKVTGRTGLGCATTDEILQWAAHKWGLSEEIERAQAQNESTWTQSAVGDGGVSYGILQIKSTYHTASYPLTERSTAFNADWAMAFLRTCIDRFGGDYWGCLGKYYWGSYGGGATYIQHVKEKLAARAWLNW